jgi:hypothetical protein
MWGCNSLIWFAVAAFVIGVVMLIAAQLRRPEQGPPSPLNSKSVGIGFVVLAIALGAASSYMSCSFTTAACPPSIGGNGYVCTNEGGGCFGITPGKCKTVAGYWPWESPCECKCE